MHFELHVEIDFLVQPCTTWDQNGNHSNNDTVSRFKVGPPIAIETADGIIKLPTPLFAEHEISPCTIGCSADVLRVAEVCQLSDAGVVIDTRHL